ncbi:hypothetical protein PR048_016709 [Dryococelus australis]|uniref:Peroxidase n=1 Tax=Dryococelus australis TaxID=614101 RepID=A0ABQ9H7J0_9NEOP|nr:hypothetical protein PR048_016709 [Dryococelus australis]
MQGRRKREIPETARNDSRMLKIWEWHHRFSAVTHFVDASNIYGSEEDVADFIRVKKGGKLRTQVANNGGHFPPNSDNSIEDCDIRSGEEAICYTGGDVRINQHPEMSVLQALFLREHNRLTDILRELNPTGMMRGFIWKPGVLSLVYGSILCMRNGFHSSVETATLEAVNAAAQRQYSLREVTRPLRSHYVLYVSSHPPNCADVYRWKAKEAFYNFHLQCFV